MGNNKYDLKFRSAARYNLPTTTTSCKGYSMDSPSYSLDTSTRGLEAIQELILEPIILRSIDTANSRAHADTLPSLTHSPQARSPTQLGRGKVVSASVGRPTPACCVFVVAGRREGKGERAKRI